MAVDLKAALSQSYAGVPGWLVAVAGGGLVYFFFLRGKTGAAGTAASSAPGSETVSAYERGYASGATKYPGVTSSGTTTDSGSGTAPAAGPLTFDYWWQQNQANYHPQPGEAPNAWINRVLGGYRSASGGQDTGVWGYQKFIAQFRSFGGTGGAGEPTQAGRGNSIGSRAADPHAYFHGSMKRQPRYPHFTRAPVGVGGAGHTEAVHDTAHTAGIHPARLRALNPLPHKFIRVA